MALYDRALPNGYILRFQVNQGAQDVAGNYSTGGWDLSIIKGSGSGKWTGYTVYWSAQIGAYYTSGSVGGYDFRAYSQLVLASGTFALGHNADGTLSVGVRGAMAESDPAPGLGTYDATGTFTFSTIPRASQVTSPTNPMEAGTSVTLNTNRASAGFTHTIEYYFGTASGTIGTGIADSTSWTVPLSLLNEIPNAAQGSGTLRTYTYSGGTLIGTRDSTFNVSAGPTILPTVTSITDSEATAGVAANIGGYVKDISKLALALVGAAGVYGSTIASYKLEVAGQTITSASGTTPAPIAASGTVVITGTVTDTRGRSKAITKNITVLPYSPPTITSVSGVRATAAGAADDEGTYIRVSINAASQSLIVGTQKNSINYKISTRLRGTTTWTLKKTVAPVAGSAVVFNSFDTVGTYPIDQAYDVLVEIYDDFSTTAVQLILPTSAIFMHWDATDGVGIGKYRQYGMLDVLGQIYQRDGKRVLDEDDLLVALSGAIVSKIDQTGTYLKVNGTGTEYGPFQTARGYLPALGDAAIVDRTGLGVTFIVGSIDTSVNLTLLASWQTYNWRQAVDAWAEPKAKKTFMGIVQLSGLIAGGTLTIGTILCVLPVGYRPDTDMMFAANNGDIPRGITVRANGNVELDSGFTASYIDLSMCMFPAAGVATWTAIGAGGSGSSFATNISDFGTSSYGLARYWKDPLGFVWMAGMIKSSVIVSADSQAYFTLPSTHAAYSQMHFLGIANGLGVGMGTSGTPFATLVNKVINNIGAGGWISLCGIMIPTTDSRSLNTWVTPAAVNSWAQYPGAFTQFGLCQRADGLVVINGLLTGGTIGVKVFSFGPRVAVEKNMIMQGQSAGNISRVDFYGTGGDPDQRSSMRAGGGSNVWFSLDNMKWIPD